MGLTHDGFIFQLIVMIRGSRTCFPMRVRKVYSNVSSLHCCTWFPSQGQPQSFA